MAEIVRVVCIPNSAFAFLKNMYLRQQKEIETERQSKQS